MTDDMRDMLERLAERDAPDQYERRAARAAAMIGLLCEELKRRRHWRPPAPAAYIPPRVSGRKPTK